MNKKLFFIALVVLFLILIVLYFISKNSATVLPLEYTINITDIPNNIISSEETKASSNIVEVKNQNKVADEKETKNSKAKENSNTKISKKTSSSPKKNTLATTTKKETNTTSNKSSNINASSNKTTNENKVSNTKETTKTEIVKQNTTSSTSPTTANVKTEEKKEETKTTEKPVLKDEYVRNDTMIAKMKSIIENNASESMLEYGFEVIEDKSIIENTNYFTFTEKRLISKIYYKFGTIKIYAQDHYYGGEYIQTQCFIL